MTNPGNFQEEQPDKDDDDGQSTLFGELLPNGKVSPDSKPFCDVSKHIFHIAGKPIAGSSVPS